MTAISDCASNMPAGFEPAHAGHVHVEQHEIESVEAQLLERRFTALRIVNLVSLAGERDAHDAPNLRVVVDHENAARAHVNPPCGSSSVKVVPAARSLTTRTVPPCAWAIRWTIARPIPVPGICVACAPR